MADLMIGEILELRKLLHNRILSPADLKALQERKLRAVIRHAWQKVPYYHSLFRSAGLSPEDIRTVEDLQYVPITTKEELRAAGLESITAKGIDLSSCLALHTSGSTGKPFTVYLTRREARTRRLIEFRALLSTGFRPRDRLAVLGPQQARPRRLHDRLELYRTEVISALLSVEDQIRCLRRMQPTVLWAYPTVLLALLQRFDYRLSRLARPRALITSAEVFDEVMKERLRADINIEMFNFYGAREVGRIAAECPAHEGLHVNADQVILECLEGDRPAGWGKPGVVVLTSLNALVMPFIRYRLGDICMLIKDHCSCGSPFPLIGPPRGRDWDMIRLPSGRLLSPLGFHFILRRCPGIDQFRFIQESSEHFVLQLSSRKGFAPESLLQLRSRLMEHLSEPVRLDIQLVDFIWEGAAKFKAFISKPSQTNV
jgi:phenylacetate-CoA ligase